MKAAKFMMAISLQQLQSVALVLLFNRATAALGSSELTKFSCAVAAHLQLYPVSYLKRGFFRCRLWLRYDGTD